MAPFVGESCGDLGPGEDRGPLLPFVNISPFSLSSAWKWLNLLGECVGVVPLLLGLPGIFGRITGPGDEGGGEETNDWRRKGEERGDPKERGDGLYGVVFGVPCSRCQYVMNNFDYHHQIKPTILPFCFD